MCFSVYAWRILVKGFSVESFSPEIRLKYVPDILTTVAIIFILAIVALNYCYFCNFIIIFMHFVIIIAVVCELNIYDENELTIMGYFTLLWQTR